MVQGELKCVLALGIGGQVALGAVHLQMKQGQAGRLRCAVESTGEGFEALSTLQVALGAVHLQIKRGRRVRCAGHSAPVK